MLYIYVNYLKNVTPSLYFILIFCGGAMNQARKRLLGQAYLTDLTAQMTGV